MKIIIIHNTVTEYRVPFFNELAKLVDLTLVFFDIEENKRVYGDVDRTSELVGANVYVAPTIRKIHEIMKSEKFDALILPPIDDWDSFRIFNAFLKYNLLKGVYWEKWGPWQIEAPLFVKVKKIFSRYLRSRAVKKIDFALASGNKAKEYLIKLGMDAQHIHKFINSTTIDDDNKELFINLRQEFHIPKNRRIVLYLGRLVGRKGIHVLIESFAKIYHKMQLSLIIAGDGEEMENAKKRVEDLKISKFVTFVGKIEVQDRAAYYKQSDVFVLPSLTINGYTEAWGLTVNEALQFKLPVVASSAVGSAYDLIVEGVNGFIFAENDSVALAVCIVEALKINRSDIPKLKHNPTSMAGNTYEAIEKELQNTAYKISKNT